MTIKINSTLAKINLKYLNAFLFNLILPRELRLSERRNHAQLPLIKV